MKLAWITDIHLNFIEEIDRKKFYIEIINSDCEAILISGDIAEAPCLVNLLAEIEHEIKKNIYFILGNHDYYRGDISQVRESMKALTISQNKLFWLPAAGLKLLDKKTTLIGQDGWADGRYGDYTNSRVALNDSRMISDLFQAKIISKFKLLEKMQQLADADAIQLQNNLREAILLNPNKVIILTHVPPFKEACLHEGQLSDENWLPYFSSKIMGDVLLKIAEEHTSIEFLALCGHTHSEANYQPLPNLTVKVGKSIYYQPQIQEIIYI